MNTATVTVEFTCRLCQRPGACEVPADFGQVLANMPPPMARALEGCVKLLCHHRCFTIWETCRNSERRLGELAARAEHTFEPEQIAKLRKRVEAVFNAWCANEARRFVVRPTNLWQPDMVNEIVTRSRTLEEVLADARERTRRLSRDPNFWAEFEATA